MPRPKRIPNKGTARTWAEIADVMTEDNYLLGEYLGIPDSEIREYEARTVQTIGRRAIIKLRAALERLGVTEEEVARYFHDRDAQSPTPPPAGTIHAETTPTPEDRPLRRRSLHRVK